MTAEQNETKSRRSVLVAGAQGVSGNAVLKQYAALSGTTVFDYPADHRKAEEMFNTFPSTC